MKKLINSLLISASILLTACGVGAGASSTMPNNSTTFKIPADGTYYIKNRDMQLVIKNNAFKTFKFRDDPTIYNLQSFQQKTKCFSGHVESKTFTEFKGINCSSTDNSITTTLTLNERYFVTVTFYKD